MILSEIESKTVDEAVYSVRWGVIVMVFLILFPLFYAYAI